MRGFLGIPDLEAPADGAVCTYSAPLGRALWSSAISVTSITTTSRSSLCGSINVNSGVTLGGTNPSLTGTTQQGLLVDWRGNNAATANIRGAFFRAGTNGTGFTAAVVTAAVFGNVVVGAGDTVTRGIALTVTPISGCTNNYGITHSTGTPSTGNYFLYDDAGYASKVSGVWTYTDTTASTVTTNGCAVFSGGVGVAGALNIGDTFAIRKVTTSTAFNDLGALLRTFSDATANTTHKASPTLGLQASIWNGASADARYFYVQTVGVSGTNSAYELLFGSDNVGRIMSLRGDVAAIGFLGASASIRTAITGSRGGNAALANLLTELATKGLITDSTSA